MKRLGFWPNRGVRAARYAACWLLPVLAAGTSGCFSRGSASSVVSPRIAFRDVAGEQHFAHRWGPHKGSPLNIRQEMGCGCAFLDANHDGRLDVLLVGEPTCSLYLNQDGKSFRDATHASGLDQVTGPWTGCAVGDADGDGYLDLVLTGYNRLAFLRGGPDGRFTDATAASGLHPQGWATSAGFMDLEGNGKLDLVVGSYVQFDEHSRQSCLGPNNIQTGCAPSAYPSQYVHLYQNDGRAHFRDVTEASGLKKTHGNVLVVAFADYDGDGKSDFYLGNDGKDADLMHNLGGLRFENTATMQGVALGVQQQAQAAMGADWSDYDQDGKPDLVVTTFNKEPFSLYHNQSGYFDNTSTVTGLAAATLTPLGFGTKFLDVDNDGWLDLIFTNGHVYDNVHDTDPSQTYRQTMQLFHSESGQHWTEISRELGAEFLRPMVGRGLATGDFDGDGRVDVLVVDHEDGPRLLHNVSTTPGHWLELELQGAPPNRYAYGAEVRVHAGTLSWWGVVSPASSFLSSSSLWQHVGLGSAAQVDDIEVRWSNGQREHFRPAGVDRKILLTQGTGTRSFPAPGKSVQ